EKCKEIFGFCTREYSSVSEARIIGHQGLIQNTFELRSIYTVLKSENLENNYIIKWRNPAP
ncbi:MAG: hypothetical protein WCV50_05915, partial [Patescibacteria group bacterium]